MLCECVIFKGGMIYVVFILMEGVGIKVVFVCVMYVVVVCGKEMGEEFGWD